MAFSAKRNNYTAVLERVYGISEGRIIHIHGSLRDHECDPVLGHGNIERIEQIDERLEEAGRMYDEKEISICKVIRDYYESTYKDVNRYVSPQPPTAGNFLEFGEFVEKLLANSYQLIQPTTQVL